MPHTVLSERSAMGFEDPYHLLQAVPIIDEWLAGRSDGLKCGRPFLSPEEKLSDEVDAVVQMLPMPYCSGDLPQNFLLLFRLLM